MVKKFKTKRCSDGVIITKYLHDLEEVEIPEIINNNPVVGIGTGCFSGNKFIKKITIPKTVKHIEAWAFNECSGLKKVVISNGVLSIDAWAFYNCNNLKSITIPKSVIFINTFAFCGCAGLKEIKVSDENKNYSSQGGVLFNKNKTLLIRYPAKNTRKTYEIPNSVETLNIGAFANCHNLVSIKMSNGVRYIGSGAFDDCKNLTGLNIPFNFKTIFHGCVSTVAEEYAKKHYNKFRKAG